MSSLIEIRNLNLSFATDEKDLILFRSLNLELQRGKILGIVGESGSGKSTLAYSIMRLLPSNTKDLSGEIVFDGTNLSELNESEMRRIRGKKISMVFQDPATSLNPVFRIRDQLLRVLKENSGLQGNAARKYAIQLLSEVELGDPSEVLDSFPYELSGGMQQRVMLAMALACNPELIIADEPTSAVDATIQLQILSLLRRLKTERHFSMILITHSMMVAREICDVIAVMYAGEIVEVGSSDLVFSSPKHPYTQALIASIPTPRNKKSSKSQLRVISGQVPDLSDPPDGCRFHPRCSHAMLTCKSQRPPLSPVLGSSTDIQQEPTKVACFLYGNGV